MSRMLAPLKSPLRILLATAIGFLPMVPVGLAGESLDEPLKEPVLIQTLKTHSRVVVRVDESVPYEWKNSKAGFELFLKGVGLNDLGVPLGEEESFQARFNRLKDPRIESMKFTEAGGGLKIEGRWRFPAGSQALASPEMESFDYRDKNPPRFIADLWHKKGPTVAEVAAAKKQAQQAQQIRKSAAEEKSRAERRVAAVREKRESEDLLRFCREPLSERNDVFLKFRPFHEPVRLARWIGTTTPDTDFQYYEPAGKEKDAQYVRLALELYRQGKPALVVRTLDFFETEHPDSPYRQEMRFLRANALVKLGLAKEAETVLSALMTGPKETPVALHSAMYVASRRLEEKSWLAALDAFLWLNRNSPNHRLSWLFRLGTAEAYYGLKQTERAAKEYQWVVENAPERRQKAEGATRLGDLYMERFQSEQGLAAYSLALSYFGEDAGSFPAVGLNRAEAFYQLGQMDRAKETFEEFLKKFPAHPAGWRATFRLGEIAARTADLGNAGARTWFYETINRHPYSAGATLARARLLPCGDHAGMAAEGAERFFAGEAERFDGKGEVVMDGFAEFRGLARIRSLVAFGREDKAAEASVRELLANRNPESRPAFTRLFSVLFRKRVLTLLAEGKKLEAVSYYQEKSAFIPAEARSSDPEYLLKLSQAASDLGFGKVGEEIASLYRNAVARGRMPAEESAAGADALQRNYEQKFTEAKALFVSKRPDSGAKVRTLLAAVGEESPFSFEREIILGMLDEKEGRLSQALQHAIRAQLLRPAKSTADLRLESWVASLESRAGDSRIALEMFRSLEGAIRAQTTTESGRVPATASSAEVLGLPASPALESLILAQAEILEKEKRWGEAASTYGRAVEAKLGGPQATFGYARALIRTAEHDKRAKGIEVLKALAQGNENHWTRLAKEMLANETNNAGLGKTPIAKEGKK